MKIEQNRWTGTAWEPKTPGTLGDKAQLVLLFAGTTLLKDPTRYNDVKRMYPAAHIMGCSTAGEICGTRVFDDSMVCTAVQFEHTQLKGVRVDISQFPNSFAIGEKLAQSLDKNGLEHVFVLSDGLKVNGSELVKGLVNALPKDITVTGGLSGDGDRFKETYVVWNAPASVNTVAAIGLYGTKLKIGYGSLGGWDPFGPERMITKAKANVLYELDGKSALELYKSYLGEHAKGLPATGLLFPLSLRLKDGTTGLVRTILGVDEKEQSMTFAGDMPEGAYARLMKANFDRLIDGATSAARTSHQSLDGKSPELAILISCVGRKMILKQRIEEEVEGVRSVLGANTVLTGFYSYGEISPFTPNAKCELHNQTMTITTLSEN